MARPVDEEKRHEIALAALKVLRQRGVQNTRMSHVAEAIGMNRTTLYWYFGSFSELFEYAVVRLRDEEAAFVATQLQQASHPLDALYTCVRGSYDYYASRGLEDFVFLICQGWVAGDSDQRERFSRTALRFIEPSRQLLIGLIAGGIATGQVRPCDPARLADFAICVLNGAIVTEVIGGFSGDDSFLFFKDHVLAPLRCGEEG